MFSLKIFRKCSQSIRDYSMKGKIISSAETMSGDEIKSILWTAIELKQLLEDKSTKVEDVKNAKVTFIMQHHSIFIELPALIASELLGIKLNIIIDKRWDNFIHDTLKFLDMNSDLTMIQSKFQCVVDKQNALKRPFFTVESRKYKVMQTLSDFMTMQLKYGKLKGLKLAWLGPPTRILNTYLCMGTRLGMDISYRCSGEQHKMQSPAVLELAKEVCCSSKSTLQESTDLNFVVRDAKVIAISEKGDDNTSLNFDVLRLAGPDCSAIFELPRVLKNVDPALVEDEKCLVWSSIYNTKWIFAAMMLRLLSDYKHTTKIPAF